MAGEADWVSLREFSRRVGVTVSSVQKGLENGRIERRSVDKKIHWPSQSVAWNKNRDTARVRGNVFVDAPVPSGPSQPAPLEDPGTANSMSKAKLINAIATAEMKKLELGRMSDTLVDKRLVEKAQFVFCRTFRDAVLNIPDRVCAEVGANITQYIEQLVTVVFGVEQASKVMTEIDLMDVERIVKDAWTKESRYVLEHIKDYQDNGVTGRG